MELLGSVQQKMSCVFETKVLQEQSTKREHQPYKVVATETVKQRAVDSDIYTARATEKLDGTCVYIHTFDEKPWLWARFDRKPTKAAERRFRKFQQLHEKQGSKGDKFVWDLEKDFKETPAFWIPASGARSVNGALHPDDLGHTPGWVPVCTGSRQYCWHLAAVDLANGTALVLREEDDDSEDLKLELVPLSELEGHTAELIGTNINGNPYSIGTKKCPLHCLVIHGSLPLRDRPEISAIKIKDWFLAEGQVEGIVWHCANKTLFKVHRNHMALPWPVESPWLSGRPVKLQVDGAVFEDSMVENPVFACLSRLYGHRCDTLAGLAALMSEPATGDTGTKNNIQGDKQSGDAKIVTAATNTGTIDKPDDRQSGDAKIVATETDMGTKDKPIDRQCGDAKTIAGHS